MIRGLLLIFDGSASWEKIAKAQRGFFFILAAHLLPLLGFTLGLEAFALTRLGEDKTMSGDLILVSPTVALRFFGASVLLGLIAVFILARLIQQITHGLQERPTYLRCFTTVAYGLSPLYLLHLLDALPAFPTWVCFGVGLALSIMVIYLGIPQVLRPDPANALGIYLIISVLVVVMMGLVHFLALQVLHDTLNFRSWERLLH